MLTEDDIKLMDEMIKFPRGRKEIIDTITQKYPDNWQDVATPYDICGEMIDLVNGKVDIYAVLFSMEFLEVMIYEKGIKPEQIVFMADCEAEYEVALKMYPGIHAMINGKNAFIIDGKFSDNGIKMLQNFIYTQINNGENTMKFEKLAVLMNPPYQIQSDAQQNRTGGKQQAKPLYHKFIESIIDNMNPDYMVSINPSRWMVGGMGLDKFRERMMNDKRIKKIVHFPGEKEVFPTVSIKGGVNYFLWDKLYDGECEFCHDNTSSKRSLNAYDIVLQDNNAFSILEKIYNKNNSYISEKAFSRGAFDLKTNFNNWSDEGIKCYTIGEEIKYVLPINMNDKHNILPLWKVCTSKAGSVIPSGNDAKIKIIGNVFIAEANAVSTDTYMIVNTFNTKKEAEIFISYMKTKFFRFMLGLRVLTQDINKEKFAWVPDVQDYSRSWTDAELYKMFGLTRQEIAYIESKIKEI